MQTRRTDIQRKRKILDFKKQKNCLMSVLESECSVIAVLFANESKGFIIGGRQQYIKLAGLTVISTCEGTKFLLQSHEKPSNCCTLAQMW